MCVQPASYPSPSVSCAPAAPLRSAALAPSRLAARRPRSRRPGRARRPSRRSCPSRCPTAAFSTTGFASLLLLFRQQLSPQRLQLRRSAGALAENVLHNARIAATERVAAVFAYDVGRLAHLLANDSDRSPDLAGAQWHHHWRCALLGRANRLERRVESSGASSSCCWRGVGSGRRGLHQSAVADVSGRGRRVRGRRAKSRLYS